VGVVVVVAVVALNVQLGMAAQLAIPNLYQNQPSRAKFRLG